MGTVYLAVHVGPGGASKLLVIKQLRTDVAALDEARAMFLDEARLSMRLNHPNIVQTIEVVDDAEDLYLVMEFLDGQSLTRVFDGKYSHAFPLRTKLHVLTDALEGLHYAHDLADYDGTPLQVVHRDVSPHNVFVTYDGHVKLVDFGIAKAADATTVTESGVFKGKVRYASPEQALCGDVDRRADIFAVGTILWEILAGRRMWEGRADAVILASLATNNIPQLRNVKPDVPSELEAICTKALAHNPAHRFQTAAEFRAALLEYEPSLPSERTLGKAIVSVFGADRRAIHAVIDAQAKAMREAMESRQTLREIPLIPAAPASGPLPTAPPTTGPLPSSDDPSVSRQVVTAASLLAQRVRPAPRRTIWLAGGAAAAVIAVAGISVALSGHSKTSAESLSPSAAPAPRATVHLSFHAIPATARFVLDGAPLPGNPYEADVARDEAPHRLSVQADGFDARQIDARFSRDVNIDVALAPSAAPLSAPVAPPPAPVRPAPAAAPARPVATSASQRGPQRGIDEEDPYKQ